MAGQSIGRYQIVSKLGENASGTRYRAHDPNLVRDVVLTVVAKDRAASAQALAKLQHPNVIGVYDVGAHRGDVYLASELVEGRSLAAWLDEKPRTWREIVDAFQQVGQGIAAAHAVGLTHGALALDDVLVGNDGRIRVGDFQAAEASERGDQRALCVALDEALTKSRGVPTRIRTIVRRGQAEDFSSMAALVDALASDPTSGRRRWLIAGGAVAVATAAVVGIVILGTHPREATCVSARPLLDDAWGPQQRARLTAAFDRLDQPWAKAVHTTVESSLDRYTARWVEMTTESCEATRVQHKQSPLVLDLRSECLGHHLDELREVVGVLAEGDVETLEQSITIVDGLESLEDCADVAALTAPVRPPASPEARAAVDGLRKQLARGRALANAAKFADAAQVASKVVDRARDLHYRPLEAEALLDLSNALEREGNYREAEEAAQNASHAAQAGKHDQVAAQALIALVWVTGGRGHKYDRAHDFASQAAAAIERLDHKADLQGELARSLGATYANEGRLDDALKEESRYLGIVESSDGKTAPIVGGVLVEIGEIYREQGHYDEALVRYERALKIFEAAYGNEHPTVAVPLNDLGLVSHRIGHDAEALEYHQRALAIFSAVSALTIRTSPRQTDLGVVCSRRAKPNRRTTNFSGLSPSTQTYRVTRVPRLRSISSTWQMLDAPRTCSTKRCATITVPSRSRKRVLATRTRSSPKATSPSEGRSQPKAATPRRLPRSIRHSRSGNARMPSLMRAQVRPSARWALPSWR